MKRLNLLYTVLFMFMTVMVYAQPETSTSEAGKCYAKCMIPDQYETVTEDILVREASSRVDVVDAVYENMSEEVLAKEASTTISVTPATFETATENALSKEASTILAVRPATFETASEEVLTREAGRAVSISPATFETMSEKVLVKENTTGLRPVAAKFETVSEQVLLRPAFKQLTVVPATFEDVTEEVLVKEAYDVVTIVPAQYETVTEDVLEKEAYSTIMQLPAITDYDALMAMLDNGGSSYTISAAQARRAGIDTNEDVVRTFSEKELAALRSLKGTNATLRADANGNVYATMSEEVLAKQAYNTMTVIPAQYETITEEVLEKEAYTTMTVIPAQYETVTEEVLVKEASTRIEKRAARYETMEETIEVAPESTKWVKKRADANCLSADPNDCITWCLEEVPARFETITKRVRVGCDEGWTDNGDDCTRVVDVPAEYETRTYQKLVRAARTESTQVPAEYKTRTYQKLVSAARTESTPVAATNQTRTFEKLVMPAGTYTVTVPAKYTTRTYQKLVSGPTSKLETVPAVYETRTYKKMLTPATVQEVEVPAEYTSITMEKLSANAMAEETPCTQRMVLNNINFRSGSAELLSSSNSEIERLRQMLNEESSVTAKLVGHTDSQGGEAANQSLSQRRAKAVYDALVNAGISADRLSYEGMGESEPIATNATAEGRRQNRRTEFLTFGASADGDCHEYGNITYQKLTTDAAVEMTDVPAQYGTYSYERLASDATVETTEVPVEYTTTSYQKLSSDAAAATTEVPVSYTTRSYRKLASPASINTTEIPAEYTTVSKRKLVKAGGFTEWREVVCEALITADLYKRVQQALMDRGYDVGAAGADGIIGRSTKNAMVKFQKDNGLPVGQLDYETLKALGVRQ